MTVPEDENLAARIERLRNEMLMIHLSVLIGLVVSVVILLRVFAR